MLFAFWCVLFAAFIPWFCAAYAKKLGGFSAADNHNTRAFVSKLTGKAARAYAAQSNGLEIFPLFAAAVIIAYLGAVSPFWLNLLAVIFIISRIVYSYLYIADQATLRSVVWAVGVVDIIWLFILA